ncbi:hypothetical protein, partial [Salmonella enterica]|uniref:hypothetical protein n=2 Tax=Salmonella enterica TaxID=28901 RepID=UPI001CA4F268
AYPTRRYWRSQFGHGQRAKTGAYTLYVRFDSLRSPFGPPQAAFKTLTRFGEHCPGPKWQVK